jgi:signal transduction histidine kinase
MTVREPVEDPSRSFLSAEFLESVAHELRGPVGVTLGALDEIELVLGSEAERVKPLLSIARRGARRLLRTADRLQLTGKLEANRLDWEPERIELSTLVERATRDAEELESRRGVRVAVALPDRTCVVNVDPSWLRTVVLELVGHAIRRAKSSVFVAAHADGGAVEITITDDGADRPKSVTQGGAPPALHGPGLSLSLARNIAAVHGGSLRVEPRQSSDPSQPGASLCLVFPLAGAGSA